MQKTHLPNKNFICRVSKGIYTFYDIYEYKKNYVIKWYLYDRYIKLWYEVAVYKFNKGTFGVYKNPNELVKQLMNFIKILLVHYFF